MSTRLIKTILFLIIFCLSLNIKIARAEYCQWTNVQTGLYCSTELKDINWQEKDIKNCSNQVKDNNNQKCCCIPQKPAGPKTIPAKYIIISILVVIIGGLAGYFLVVKNNGINIKS